MDLAAFLTARLTAPGVSEFPGGHQARVFEVTHRDGTHTVAKVLDASLADATKVAIRLQVIADLANLDRGVCRPVPIDGHLVTEITVDSFEGLLTCYEYADGVALDHANPVDAWQMGQALARLHDSMRRLPPTDLPLVAALGTAYPDAFGPRQLLHGDFNSGNLRQLDGAIKIFDLDDCGYGPAAFDVANALYMVLFETSTGNDVEMYPPFKEAFVSGYFAHAGQALDDDVLTAMIDHRVAALAAWIADLSTAPIGIRTASAEWHKVLRSFVDRYNAS